MTALKKQLGRRVREIRKKRNLTQAELAERVRLSVNMIGYVERGERFPSPETFEKLAAVFNITVKDLFSFPPSNTNEDPERNNVEKELWELIEKSPKAFIVSIIEIIKTSKQLHK